MLDIVNRLLHGYVAIPMTTACRDAGLFATLQSDGPLSAEEISARLGANRGPLGAAIRLFRSLQWLACDATGRLSLTPHSASIDLVPARSLALYHIDVPVALAGSPDSEELAGWIEQCAKGWGIDDPDLSGLVDGTVMVPLLLALRAEDAIDEQGVAHMDRLCPALRGPVWALIEAKGLARADGSPTPEGQFFAERARIMATTASYRPMLAALPQLLFGDPRPVFGRDAAGEERHLDRSLNVIGSGFQHQRFFCRSRCRHCADF